MKFDNQNYNSKYVSFNRIEIYVESFGDLNDPVNKNKYAFKYQEQYGYKILKLGIAFKADNFELAYE